MFEPHRTTKVSRRRVLDRGGRVGLAALIGAHASPFGHRLLAAETSESPPRSLPRNWLWMTPRDAPTDDHAKRLFEKAKAAGVDAVVPEVYNGDHAYFEHPHPLVHTRANFLERIIPLAHEAGVEVHAWMWTVPCNNREIMQNHSDWYAVNGQGDPAHSNPAYVRYYKFLCPRRPEVREFIEGNVQALARIGDLDGVHLDYVRLPDVILARGLWKRYGIVQDREYPQYDYCYCEHCRNEFRQKTGIDPLADLEDPAASDEWRQFRYDSVSRLVDERLAPAARDAGKLVTAAVFPNWWNVRQEWHTWNLDAFLPMLYHTFYEEDIAWIGDQTRAALERFEKPKPIYAGLFVSSLPPDALAEAIASSKTGGASGVALFSAGSMKDAHWELLRAMR